MRRFVRISSASMTISGLASPAPTWSRTPILPARLALPLTREPAIAVFAPDSVTGFSATPFAIEVERANGGAASAKLLVAADGKRSRLRESCPYQMRELELSASGHRDHGQA